MDDGLDNPSGWLYKREDPACIEQYREQLHRIEDGTVTVDTFAEEVPPRIAYHVLGSALADGVNDEEGTIAIDDDLYDDILEELETEQHRAERRDKPFVSTVTTVVDASYLSGYRRAATEEPENVEAIQDDIYEAQHAKDVLSAGGVLGGLATGLGSMLGLAAAGGTIAVPVAGFGLIYGGRKAGIEAWKYYRGQQEHFEDLYSEEEVAAIAEQYGAYTLTIDHPGTDTVSERQSPVSERSDGQDDGERSWSQDDVVASIEALGGELPDRFDDE